MIRALTFLTLLTFCLSCNASKKATTTTFVESPTPTADTLPPIHEYSSLHGKKNLKGAPIMHFEEREQDLGTVKKGEKRHLLYPFKNLGDTELSIAIITACECTTTNQDDLTAKTYKPGEGGVLKATFDSSEKDYGELIDIEIILNQIEPGTDDIPIFEKVYYKFEIEK